MDTGGADDTAGVIPSSFSFLILRSFVICFLHIHFTLASQGGRVCGMDGIVHGFGGSVGWDVEENGVEREREREDGLPLHAL